MIKLDTETCGLIGPVVLIQSQNESDPINFHHVFLKTVRETLAHIEWLMEHHLTGFNLTFDSFHLAKCYNTLRQLNPDKPPVIAEVAAAEKNAWDGLCLKPPKVSDLFLLVKENGFQFLNNRKKIILRKFPPQTVLAIKEQLEKIPLNPLLFGKFATKRIGDVWDIERKDDWCDLILSFRPTAALKPLLRYLFGVETISYPIPFEHIPKDNDICYRPWGGPWPKYIQYHINYWLQNSEYATQDIDALTALTRWLKGDLKGTIDPIRKVDIYEEHHTNSELAWQVGVVRQRGFAVDLPLLDTTLAELKEQKKHIPVAGNAVKNYLLEVASPFERTILSRSTSKKVIESLTRESTNKVLVNRCKLVERQRVMNKQIDLLEKVKAAGRFHPDFNIIGTFSNRMSGAGGINAQGIDKAKEIRRIFAFREPGFEAGLGDFDSFEVTIIDATYPDPRLRADLLAGISPHCVYGEFIYEHEVVKGTDEYSRAKNVVFGDYYGGELPKLASIANVDVGRMQVARGKFSLRYPESARAKTKLKEEFCSLKQPGGIGTKVEWYKPADFVTTPFDYRRYFDVENLIAREIFKIAQTSDFRAIPGKIVRRDREQTIHSATLSALYAAIFNLQGANLRQAGNHRIQSTGGTICKEVQLAIWNLQPVGVTPWQVYLMNVHDELIAVSRCPEKIPVVIERKVNDLKKVVPLLSMKWKSNISSWAEK